MVVACETYVYLGMKALLFLFGDNITETTASRMFDRPTCCLATQKSPKLMHPKGWLMAINRVSVKSGASCEVD
jgi:hypothetical protein